MRKTLLNSANTLLLCFLVVSGCAWYQILIPERSGKNPEFRVFLPGIPGVKYLGRGLSEIGMGAAEPLPRVYLHRIKEMEAPLNYLTPSCSLVAPSVSGGPPQSLTIRLIFVARPRIARSLVPYALDAVCGRLSPPLPIR